MRWRLICLGLVSLTFAAVAAFQIWGSGQPSSATIEDAQKQGSTVIQSSNAEFEAPVLEGPFLTVEAIDICDGCAHNSCAPEPVAPEYPTINLEADCEAEFFLDEQGRPFDLSLIHI